MSPPRKSDTAQSPWEGHIKKKPGYIAKTQRPIHLVGERRDALIELVQGWMRDGKVENGCGEWSSPAFVVAKRGSKWRGVVDFRALNEATEADGYPLPRIKDMWCDIEPVPCSPSWT